MRRRKDTWTRTAPAEIPEWYDHAACTGMGDIFFYENLAPGRPSTAAKEQAKAICQTCKVIDLCRDYALALDDADDPYGVWGGMAADERKRERRRRRNAA